jgi:predicted DNA-binding protein
MSKKFEKNISVRLSQGTYSKIEKMADIRQQGVSSTIRMIVELYFRGEDMENLDFIKRVGGV